MSIAFVLGNGISRKNISLPTLSQHGKIYGCNALYREYTPHVLVATDRPIAEYIQQSGYAKNNRFYTRRPIEGLGAIPVPKDYYGYSSGPIAVSLAAIDGARRIYLLGFDMGPSSENRINNLYAGTEFYRRIDAPPTYTGNWIKQVCRVTQDHKICKFIRIVGPTTAKIQEFDAHANLSSLALDTFIDRINNKKDL